MMEPTVSAPLTTPSADPVHVEEAPWTIGQWKGLPNYECKLCPFSTLDLPVMEEHQEQKHAPEPASVQPKVKRRRYKRGDK